jgi:hypothetical protein
MLAAGIGVWLVSPPPGFDDGSRGWTIFPAVAALALVALASLAAQTMARARGPAVRLWLAVSAAAFLAGVGAFLAAGQAQRDCLADYDGRPSVIGNALTPLGEQYVRENPGLSPRDLLFDAAGDAERLWTPASIARCRAAVGTTHALWIPLLVVCLLGAAQAVSARPMPLVASRPAAARDAKATHGGRDAAGSPARYDVFLSYRHGGPDGQTARHLLDTLEAHGYRVAIDERDFPANESFLLEMERSVRESRFTLAVVSARYLESDNCQEEAIICKVLDMGERKRRLVPVLIEPVAMPAWLYGIVGVDLTKPDPLVDPIEKLIATLGPPMGAAADGPPR